MRLFHVSEEKDIRFFDPRPVTRRDLDQSKRYVWALNERYLPNFLTPRDCPRVTWHVQEGTAREDCERFFSSQGQTHGVAIEWDWFGRMRETVLYLYEFHPQGFVLQDGQAGYYVSEQPQTPIAQHRIDDLFDALAQRNVEFRCVHRLWKLRDEIAQSTLGWSFCRMGNAQR